MKATLYDHKGKEKGTINLPKAFNKKMRPDILAKVYEAQKGLYQQATGAKEGAGAQYSASGILKHKRHDWKSTYGKGISRIPRKIMSRHGASFNWIGATVSSTRGGRRPHAPRAQKNLIKKINKKELEQAYYTALTGTINKEALEQKYGRTIPTGIIFEGTITKNNTKELMKTLKQIYKEEQLQKKKSVRAGKGTMRGRKYKSNAGLLFIIGNKEEMKRTSITTKKVEELTIKDLAPNGEPGRITCYTEEAIKNIGERFA
jgi:large subunit ribosomal protein L4e